MSSTLELYKKVTALPQGKRVFSVLYGQKAPYFASIHMQVQEMKPHLGKVVIPKRRSVKNHIGTVHAIAACNGLEAAMGLLAEATCPADMRWLPKGMDVKYLAKSTTALTCTAETIESDWANGPDVPVRVKAVTTDGTVTVEGTIHLWVTPKGS
ncbi:hotdog fold domain-containing protein [Aeromicrobium sp. P5_D10]